jgi:hypothetical protein
MQEREADLEVCRETTRTALGDGADQLEVSAIDNSSH